MKIKKNNSKGNYEVIINIRINKQSIDVRRVIDVIVNVEMREKLI